MWHTSDGLSISQYIKLAVRYTLLLRFILLFFRVRARKLGRDHEISFFFLYIFRINTIFWPHAQFQHSTFCGLNQLLVNWLETLKTSTKPKI